MSEIFHPLPYSSIEGPLNDYQNWYLVERADKPLGYVYSELLKDAQTVRQDEEARRNEGQARREEEKSRLAADGPPAIADGFEPPSGLERLWSIIRKL